MGGDNDEFYEVEYKPEYKNPVKSRNLNLISAKFNGRTTNLFYDDEPMKLELAWENMADIPNLSLRIEIQNSRRIPITSYIIEDFYSGKKGETHSQKFRLDISQFAYGRFFVRYIFYSRKNETAAFDDIEDTAGLAFRRPMQNEHKRRWSMAWGSIKPGVIELVDE
jgi:lipopolysaccharide transport system ATP-binding protein